MFLFCSQEVKCIERPLAEKTDLPQGVRFLPKPYTPVEVTGVRRELMGEL
jgi:hypothetical protein